LFIANGRASLRWSRKNDLSSNPRRSAPSTFPIFSLKGPCPMDFPLCFARQLLRALMTDWVAIRASRVEIETRWKAEMAATQKVGTVQLNGRSRVATSSSATSGRSRAVIGIRDLAFHQEVLDWLDRDFHVELVGAAADQERLLWLLKPDQADVVVACPEMAKELAHPSARTQRPRTLVVAQEMTVPVLREAIEIGAFGVFAWPEERSELAREISVARKSSALAGARRAEVVAIFGARGGAGVTFVATQLAAALADREVRCALVDLQAGFADLTTALGVGAEEHARTVADLLPVMDELTPAHVLNVLHRHHAGFAVLLAPSSEQVQWPIPFSLYEACIDCLATEFEVIVLQLPRAPSNEAAQAMTRADRAIMVMTLDLFSLSGAQRAKVTLGLGQERCPLHVVVNKRARGEITPVDVERILEEEVFGSVRFDRRVKRAQDRGQLLRTRARGAVGDIRRLARALQVQWAGRGEAGGL